MQAAVRELRGGFRENEIGVIARDDTTGEDVAEWSRGDSDYTEENIGTGAPLARSGARPRHAVAVGIAAGVTPAIGPVIASGLRRPWRRVLRAAH